MDPDDERARAAAEAVARRSYGKLVAFLGARTRDLAAVEDALADAFARALAEWPGQIPASPEGWLLTVARRRLIDGARHMRVAENAMGALVLAAEEAAGEPGQIPDQRLALMFACAHPALDAGIRAPLVLQVVLGLDARRIASAFLTSPAAMSKRLVRAKDKIRQAGIPFHVPERRELGDRLDAVLGAIYATFAEGWSDPVGADVARRDLTGEALFLARLLVELLPDEPEALGLLALMLYAEARRPARRDPSGAYVPLHEQDPRAWDAAMIDEAEAHVRQAGTRGTLGRYQLEAALQSAHVHRRRSGRSNWADVVRIYDVLLALTDSPVVALNRAVALAELAGPQVALASLPAPGSDPRLDTYQPYWAARADLLARSDEPRQARAAYDVAIGLERDPAVRAFLQRRQAALVG